MGECQFYANPRSKCHHPKAYQRQSIIATMRNQRVPVVLQVLFVLGLVADVVGLLVCTTTNVVVAHVACAGCLRRGVVRWERTQRACRQRITSARVGGASAARRDWYIKRLDHVLTFEQQKSMLAWSKQTLMECTYPRVRQGRARLCRRECVILLAFAGRRATA